MNHTEMKIKQREGDTRKTQEEEEDPMGATVATATGAAEAAAMAHHSEFLKPLASNSRLPPGVTATCADAATSTGTFAATATVRNSEFLKSAACNSRLPFGATATSAETAAATCADATTPMGTTAATATAHPSQILQPPSSNSFLPDRTEMYMIEAERDEDIELDNGYFSDTEMSQKELVEQIKDFVEKSVEREIKKRTTNKRKRKGNHYLPDEEEGCEEETKAYSRYSVPYVYSVFQSILSSEHRKGLVKKMGFEHMLQLDDCNVPRVFAQWLADNTIPHAGIMKIGDTSIPISPMSFQDILGIPAGELPVETDEIAGKAAFLELFGLSELPTIRFFGDKIIKEKDLPDAEFCRCFMSVLLGDFLCPNSSTKPSTKYLGALIDVDKISDRNWAKFAYDWFICYVTKYLKERAKQTKGTLTLGGCLYHIAVRYLDFVDFGSIKLPATMPRICVWKGKLIKHFSEMDRGKDGNYGCNTMKEFSQTCYTTPAILRNQMSSDPVIFKNEIDKVVGESMSNKVKDDLFHSFQSHMIDTDKETYSKAQSLVIDFLKIITSEGMSKPNSETTIILETQNSTHEMDADQDSSISKRQRHNANILNSKRSPETLINLESTEIMSSKHNDFTDATQDHVNKSDSSQAVNIARNTTKKRSISLNHTPSEDDGITSSCSRPVRQEKLSKGNHIDGTSEHMCMQMDLNSSQVEPQVKQIESNGGIKINAMAIPSITCIDSGSQLRRTEFLKQARKKYFFKDPSVPSFRLFENEDDNGKYIEEPELWRPLGAYSQSQDENDKIEGQLTQREIGNNFKNKEEDNDKNEEELQLPLKNNDKNQLQENSSYAYSAPKVATPAYKPSQPSNPLSNNDLKSRWNIEGRKLFQDDSDVTPTSKNQNQNELICSPEVEFLCEKLKTMSPEVQFLGERSNRVAETSPEVQFLGKRVFHNVCNDMAKRTDELYNAGLTLGTRSVSTEKENIPPKRVVHPSHFLTSPFENNNRSIIHPNEMKIYETLTTLCNDPQYKDRWIIDMNNCRVSLTQLGNSMKQNGWVEAWVINACCRKLFKDNHPKISNKHFFFHTSAITNFRKTWSECRLKDMHFENFGRVFPNLPKQKTPNDCGVFTIKYMEKYCTRNPQSCSFSARDIPESRVRIAIDTLFNSYNSKTEEMDFISTFDIQAYKSRTIRQ